MFQDFEIANIAPWTKEDLKEVDGLTAKQIEAYGDRIIAGIRSVFPTFDALCEFQRVLKESSYL